jgi:hypothetical protein
MDDPAPGPVKAISFPCVLSFYKSQKAIRRGSVYINKTAASH